MKILLIGLLVLMSLSVFAGTDKSLCTVALKWDQRLDFDTESSYLTSGIDQCICSARNEVIGTRIENRIKKVRIKFMKGEEKRCGTVLDRSDCIIYKYKAGSSKNFTVEELRDLDICLG